MPGLPVSADGTPLHGHETDLRPSTRDQRTTSERLLHAIRAIRLVWKGTWSAAPAERILTSEQEDRPVPKHKLKPNPRNIANQAKIQELEQRLER